MDEAKLVGGSEDDRKEILRLHEKYIDVNTRFDWEGLTPIYSPVAGSDLFQSQRPHLSTAAITGSGCGSSTARTSRRPIGHRSTSAAPSPAISPWCGATARPGGNGPARSRRRATSTTTTPNSSRARPWCSARRTASGAWSTRISRRRTRASAGRGLTRGGASQPQHPAARRNDAAGLRRAGVRRRSRRHRQPSGLRKIRSRAASWRRRPPARSRPGRRRIGAGVFNPYRPASDADRHGDRRARRTVRRARAARPRFGAAAAARAHGLRHAGAR